MTDPIDELLAELRADVPEMSDEAFEAGRVRLQTVIEPVLVPAEPEPDAAVVTLPKTRFLRSPPGKLVAAAAAVVVLAAGVLFVQTMRPGGPAPAGQGPDVPILTVPADGPPPIASAAEQLNAAADRVTPGPTDSIGPGQYRYLTTRSWNLLSTTDSRTVYWGPNKQHLPPLAFFTESIEQLWVPADAPNSMCYLQNTRTDKEKWVIGDEQAARAAGWQVVDDQNHPMDDQGCYFYDEWGNGRWGAQPGPQFLAGLPRDPAQLYNRLHTDDLARFSWEGDRDEAMVNAVGATLRSGVLPPDLRSALLRALAMMPGLEVTQQAAEVDGRTGTAFGVSRNGEISDLVIDTATGEFIATRTIDEDGDYYGVTLPPRTIVYYLSAAEPVVVDRVGATG
jgi:hypothetical protein